MGNRRNLFARVRAWTALVGTALLLAACNATLSAFVVPGTTWAGHDFLIVVAGVASGSNPTTGDRAGCVLQVPLGFTVVSRGPGTADDPALLQLYTAEAGHYLVSQSGFCNASTVSTQFVVRAPGSPGTFTFKTSIAGFAGTGSFHAVDPPSTTAFAQITAPAYQRQTSVQPTTADLFAIGAPLPVAARSWVLRDVDRDGQNDLVTGLGPQVWLARAGNTWLNRSPVASGSPLDEVAVGDFDGDGNLDLVHASRRVYFGDGLGNWTTVVLQPPTNAAVRALGAGDFDGDGRDDILECDGNGWLRCFHSDPGRTFHSLSYGLPAVGTAQTQLDFADLDLDGFPDIVGTSGAWRGNGIGTWSLFAGIPFACARRVIADLIGTTHPEILIVPAGANSAISMLVTANGTSWVSSLLPFGPSINSVYGDVVAGDFDGDGSMEVVLGGVGLEAWRFSGGTAAQLTSTGLPQHLATSAGSGFNLSPTVGRLQFADLDGDGRSELIASSYLAGDWGPLAWTNLTTGVVAYGVPCSANGWATPLLAANGLPTVGNAAFALDAHGQPLGIGFSWFGLSRRWRLGQPILPFPLAPYGAPGCTVLAEDLAVGYFAFDAAGAASIPFPLPNDPSLRYVSVFAQQAMVAGGANPLGVLTSNALSIRID